MSITSRGAAINEKAMYEALRDKRIAGAALDTFEVEPLPADSPIWKHPKINLTPHIAASTTEAQETVGIEVAEQIADVLNGGVIRNAVNMPTMDANAVKVLGPYIDLGTKLGTLVQQIAPAQIATLRITYWGKIVDLDVNDVAGVGRAALGTRVVDVAGDVPAGAGLLGRHLLLGNARELFNWWNTAAGTGCRGDGSNE